MVIKKKAPTSNFCRRFMQRVKGRVSAVSVPLCAKKLFGFTQTTLRHVRRIEASYRERGLGNASLETGG